MLTIGAHHNSTHYKRTVADSHQVLWQARCTVSCRRAYARIMLDKTSRATAHASAGTVSSRDAYWHVVMISCSAVALARRGMVLARDMRSCLHALAQHVQSANARRALVLPAVSCAAATLLPHGRLGQAAAAAAVDWKQRPRVAATRGRARTPKRQNLRNL